MQQRNENLIAFRATDNMLARLNGLMSEKNRSVMYKRIFDAGINVLIRDLYKKTA